MTEDPFSAPASAPSINKIPFLVFDAILVITAVALALTSEGPLSPVLFFWILLCVVVGGLVGCLPFWIEFRDKVRLSEYEIRERQSSVHDSQWQYVDARLAEQNEYLQKLHLRLSDSADRLAALEARPPSPTANEVALLCGSALQKQWPAWREELLTVLSRRTDVLFNEQNAQTAKFSASHESRLSELRKEFSAVEAVLRGLETRVSEIALLSAASAATMVAGTVGSAAGTAAPVAGGMAHSGTQTLVAAEESDLEEVGGAAQTTAAQSESVATGNETVSAQSESAGIGSETVSTENEFGGAEDESLYAEDESGLDVADAAQAVSGDFTAPTSADTPASADASDTTSVDALAAEDLAAESADSNADASAASDAIADAQTGEEDIAVASTADSDSDATDAENEVIADPVAPAEAPAAVPEQPALLETPAVAPPARAGKTTGAEKTTLVAQVLIGIGNKPYVRGIGPGLSLEKGVPMQFVEIGKWEWVCPGGAVPVKIQIYKNDETPSTLGQIELEPGQRKAVTPFFPK